MFKHINNRLIVRKIFYNFHVLRVNNKIFQPLQNSLSYFNVSLYLFFIIKILQIILPTLQSCLSFSETFIISSAFSNTQIIENYTYTHTVGSLLFPFMCSFMLWIHIPLLDRQPNMAAGKCSCRLLLAFVVVAVVPLTLFLSFTSTDIWYA